jgi:hypothetical protein
LGNSRNKNIWISIRSMKRWEGVQPLSPFISRRYPKLDCVFQIRNLHTWCDEDEGGYGHKSSSLHPNSFIPLIHSLFHYIFIEPLLWASLWLYISA